MHRLRILLGVILLSGLIASGVLAQTTRLVSVNNDGAATGNGGCDIPVMSADGHSIAFSSGSSDLIATTDANNSNDVFVRNLQTNTTKLASINSAGTATGNGMSGSPVISANGQ